MGRGRLLSVVARWPVVGFVVGAGDPSMAEDPLAWRRDRGLVRVCQRLTMVLVGLYALRLAVMLPMYLAGEVTAAGRRQDRAGLAALPRCGRRHGADPGAGQHPRGADPGRGGRAALTRARPSAPGPGRGQTRPRGCRLDGDSIASRSSSTSGVVRNSSSSWASSESSRAGRDRVVLADDADQHRVAGPRDVADARPGVRASRPAGSARPSSRGPAGTGRSAPGRRR